MVLSYPTYYDPIYNYPRTSKYRPHPQASRARTGPLGPGPSGASGAAGSRRWAARAAAEEAAATAGGTAEVGVSELFTPGACPGLGEDFSKF